MKAPRYLRSVVVFMAVIGMMFGSIGMASATVTNWRGNGVENGVLESVECYPEFPDAPEGAYLHWVFTGNDATQASLYINGNYVGEMEQGGQGSGAFHYYSEWYDLDTLTAYADHDGTGGNLVISHGCPPPELNEWCSPGFWKNHTEAWPEGTLNTLFVDVFGYYPVGKDLAVGKGATKTYYDATLLFVISNPQIFGGEMTELVADHLAYASGFNFDGERYNGYDEYGKPIEYCPLAD